MRVVLVREQRRDAGVRLRVSEAGDACRLNVAQTSASRPEPSSSSVANLPKLAALLDRGFVGREPFSRGGGDRVRRKNFGRLR